MTGKPDPGNVALSLARGARNIGATIAENIKVTAVHKKAGRVTGVSWQNGVDQGHIAVDMVVNCAGMWMRDLGA
jgi:4-methylaminobutanoate oxidase (formaldehyde-forming)